jgi:hypothetical protein
MITDFASKLQGMTYDGILTCSQIVRFAKNNNIKLENMKLLLHAAGIKVKDCEQTCISLRCNYFK